MPRHHDYYHYKIQVWHEMHDMYDTYFPEELWTTFLYIIFTFASSFEWWKPFFAILFLTWVIKGSLFQFNLDSYLLHLLTGNNAYMCWVRNISVGSNAFMCLNKKSKLCFCVCFWSVKRQHNSQTSDGELISILSVLKSLWAFGHFVPPLAGLLNRQHPLLWLSKFQSQNTSFLS